MLIKSALRENTYGSLGGDLSRLTVRKCAEKSVLRQGGPMDSLSCRLFLTTFIASDWWFVWIISSLQFFFCRIHLTTHVSQLGSLFLWLFWHTFLTALKAPTTVTVYIASNIWLTWVGTAVPGQLLLICEKCLCVFTWQSSYIFPLTTPSGWCGLSHF